MKAAAILGVTLAAFLFSAAAVAQSSTPQQALRDFNDYVAYIQKNPDSSALLREKVIALALEMKPAPAIPEEAREHYVMGMTRMENAKDNSGYQRAIEEFKEAERTAPWWGDAYKKLALAQKAAGNYDGAIENLKYYVLTKPADARDAQDEIYKIKALSQAAEEQKGREANARAQAENQFAQEINQGNDDYRALRFDAAIEHYLKGLQADPNNRQMATAVCNLSGAYNQKDDRENSMKYVQKGLALEPNNVTCLRAMGGELQNSGRSGFCTYFQRACELGDQWSCQHYQEVKARCR
jgi:tetratricopeptide (TPR) repeat protein